MQVLTLFSRSVRLHFEDSNNHLRLPANLLRFSALWAKGVLSAVYGFMGADGNALACRGVVTVTINYRRSLMGYFAHPELSREAAHGVSGNYGPD